MNRDRSPKRKRRDDFNASLDIAKNYCDFVTLVNLYLAAKSVWPLFNGIIVTIPNHANVYIPTVQVWQQLLECHRYEELLDGVDIEIEQKRLPIISAALRGVGVTDITRQLGVELLNQDMLYAAALNGTKAFFDKYVAFWKPSDLRHTISILDRIPSFSGELNASYNKFKRGASMTIYFLLEHIKLSVKHRLVSGIVHCNTLLRSKVYILCLRRYMPWRRYCIQFCVRDRRHSAMELIPQCREWGHPKALRLITTLLEPMAQKLD